MTEHEIAIMEANMNEAEDAYFENSNHVDDVETRRTFRSAFRIAWKISAREAYLREKRQIKPLFIPLKSEYYKLFELRLKKAELRKYGSRWNEKTCAIGREVVLSNGYGKKNRMTGRIVDFKKIPSIELGTFSKRSVLEVYGTLNIDIAMISIELF